MTREKRTRRVRAIKDCDFCGEPFEAKARHKKTCSPKCRKALSRLNAWITLRRALRAITSA